MTQGLPGHTVAPLTARQRELLRVIVQYREAMQQLSVDTEDQSPSVRLLARRLGVHSSTIEGHLRALFVRGWLSAPSPSGLRCQHLP